ncbi:MAG TPA: YebC/PmpR family DNA-binding transcriptional regulator [Blastocatellia bacterium]|jgi:YebC/PmpR family DNA-binding regulatory protein|nr:YebC/PmpR family DNA-binding transcriptional regulator [Blastocatellia bacterium]
MSGHSKWHSIKHKKGALDAKRGKLFTKLIKEITIAARTGGSGDISQNARLRKAVLDAKAANMPNETIDRATKRGTGELEGAAYEEIAYEGYGPGGVAIMVNATTDNRNRTVSELRHLFAKNGGNLGESGSVAWMFSKKGSIMVDRAARGEDELLEIALEAGAEDMQADEDGYHILTAPDEFHAVLEAVKKAGVEPSSADITMIPQNFIHLEGREADQMLKLYEALDDHEDVQHVAANFDIDAAAMEQQA